MSSEENRMLAEILSEVRSVRARVDSHIEAHQSHAEQRSAAHIANENRIATLEAENRDLKGEVKQNRRDIDRLKTLFYYAGAAGVGGAAGGAHYALNALGVIGG